MNSPTATEQKIRGAINKAAVLVAQNDADPNDAMVKAAEHYRLNPEMTCRAVEALNIALTRSHLKVASDRTESFPIADRETVLKRAFVEADFSAPAEEAPQDVWSTGGSFKIGHVSPTPKLAEAQTPGRRDINDLVEQVNGYRQRKTAEIGRLDIDILEVHTRAEGAIRKLAQHFRYSDNRDSFGEFATEAYADIGREAEPVIAMAHQHAGYDGDAPVFQGGLRVQAFNTHSGPIADVRALLSCRTKLAELEADRAFLVTDVVAKVAALDMRMDKIAGKPGPQTFDSAADMIKVGTGSFTQREPKDDSPKGDDKPEGNGGGEKKEEKAKKSPEGAPGPLDEAAARADQKSKMKSIGAGALEGNKALVGSIGKLTGADSSPASMITGGAMSSDYDAAMVDKIRSDRGGGLTEGDIAEADSMRHSAVLQDLLLNDPILSEQPAHQVAKAYETFVGLSPRAALIPDVARGVLRNAIASQAVDPYAAKELLGLEKQLAPGEAS